MPKRHVNAKAYTVTHRSKIKVGDKVYVFGRNPGLRARRGWLIRWKLDPAGQPRGAWVRFRGESAAEAHLVAPSNLVV